MNSHFLSFSRHRSNLSVPFNTIYAWRGHNVSRGMQQAGDMGVDCGPLEAAPGRMTLTCPQALGCQEHRVEINTITPCLSAISLLYFVTHPRTEEVEPGSSPKLIGHLAVTAQLSSSVYVGATSNHLGSNPSSTDSMLCNVATPLTFFEPWLLVF